MNTGAAVGHEDKRMNVCDGGEKNIYAISIGIGAPTQGFTNPNIQCVLKVSERQLFGYEKKSGEWNYQKQEN